MYFHLGKSPDPETRCVVTGQHGSQLFIIKKLRRRSDSLGHLFSDAMGGMMAGAAARAATKIAGGNERCLHCTHTFEAKPPQDDPTQH